MTNILNSFPFTIQFNYLKFHLGGSGLSEIEGFNITTENYDTTIELLESQFSSKDILRKTHVSKLLSFQPLRNSDDAKSFIMFSNIQNEIESLENLGIYCRTHMKFFCVSW